MGQSVEGTEGADNYRTKTRPFRPLDSVSLPHLCYVLQRDGMNLVSYEYVACQSDNAGVLVLSEFAGGRWSKCGGACMDNVLSSATFTHPVSIYV